MNGDRNPPGRKRPVLRGPKGRMTPLPWLGGDGPLFDQWNYVSSERAMAADDDHLCIMCGEHRGDNWVYALINGRPSDHVSEYFSFFDGSPAPTYGHPECILKAVLYCPHLKNQDYPAMTQDRTTKLSADDLKKIVQETKNKERLLLGIGQYGHARERANAKG